MWGLGLAYNDLTGEIPASFANLTELSWIFLAGNQLEGLIPAGLCNMPGLEGDATLGYNKLSGVSDGTMNCPADPDWADTQNAPPPEPEKPGIWQDETLQGILEVGGVINSDNLMLKDGILYKTSMGDGSYEWGYWTPDHGYITLGWTWTGDDGGTAYTVPENGPVTEGELQAIVAAMEE
jgi:hypothetical protein